MSSRARRQLVIMQFRGNFVGGYNSCLPHLAGQLQTMLRLSLLPGDHCIMNALLPLLSSRDHGKRIVSSLRFSHAACRHICCSASQESATLYHCDLSYCCMDAASCALLGEGLRDNHSLYGLHIVGDLDSCNPAQALVLLFRLHSQVPCLQINLKPLLDLCQLPAKQRSSGQQVMLNSNEAGAIPNLGLDTACQVPAHQPCTLRAMAVRLRLQRIAGYIKLL